MASTDLQAWLGCLQPGSEVAIKEHLALPLVATVHRISPNGYIVLSNGVAFSPDGKQFGGNPYRRFSISPVTEEVRRSVERTRMIAEVKRTNFDIMPVEQLRQVADLLRTFSDKSLTTS